MTTHTMYKVVRRGWIDRMMSGHQTKLVIDVEATLSEAVRDRQTLEERRRHELAAISEFFMHMPEPFPKRVHAPLPEKP